MTKLEALKTLYAALGGTPADAAELETVVEVLNAIAELFEGETADTIADAVNNIAEIAGGISPTPTLITKNITENGTYTASTEDADGYSSVTVNVPSGDASFSTTPAEFIPHSNMISVNVPNGVTSIGDAAFKPFRALVSVNIPNSVTSIGDAAFQNCSALTSIEIPSGVTTIGTDAFEYCTNLATITIHKAEGSITGAPWGAPNTTTVIWDG